MCPPTGSPLKSKSISMYFPNLLELSFLFVRALPKLSKTALDFRRTSLTLQILKLPIILGLSLIFFEILFQYTWWPLVPYFWSWVTRKCTSQLFLSQTCETFVLSWLGFPKTSHNFPKTSECCQKCPKTFWQPQAPPKLLKGTILVCFETVTTQSQH